jgi:hypothetical protein
VHIALDGYAILVDTMKSLLNHIRQRIQVQNSPKFVNDDIHWGEINWLDTMIKELEIDLNSFQKLLLEETWGRNPSTSDIRNERGLINVLGYGIKYLFGTVMSEM